MAEPYLFWTLIVGLVIGGVVVWASLGRLPRSSEEIPDEELAAEASWISRVLADSGRRLDPEAVEQVLTLHRQYLAEPPLELSPDEAEEYARRRRDGEAAATAPPPSTPAPSTPAAGRGGSPTSRRADAEALRRESRRAGEPRGS